MMRQAGRYFSLIKQHVQKQAILCLFAAMRI